MFQTEVHTLPEIPPKPLYQRRWFLLGVIIIVIVVVGMLGDLFSDNEDGAPSSLWTRRPDPVFTGQFNVASDPMVLRKGNLYHMYYTCLDELAHTAVCLANSQDGISWHQVDQG